MAGDLKDWAPCARPGGEVLTGKLVKLEPLDWEAHLGGLFEAVAGPGNDAIWDYMPFGPFPEMEDFQSIFEHVRTSLRWQTLVIRAASDETILGTASYMRIREAHGSCEVGCVAFGPALQRTSAATEAMALMAAHVFDQLGYRRYEWKCNNANDASRRAAVRLGFQFEGIFRNDMVAKGVNRDTAWFAMTDADWPSIKAGFDTWLSSDNFASDGQQISSLETCRTGE